jgi:hypothetical protein
MKVAVLLPYGIFQQSNLQYKDYIDRAYGKLSANQFDYLFLAGGRTNKDFSNLSEAQSIYEYLLKRSPDLKEKIFLEEKSLTTVQNLEFIVDILASKNLSADEVMITCDSIRLNKVFVVAAFLFAKQSTEEEILESLLQQGIENNIKMTEDSALKFKQIVVYGLNIHRSIDEVAAQISNTLLEANFLKYPKLHQIAIVWRKKILGLK